MKRLILFIIILLSSFVILFSVNEWYKFMKGIVEGTKDKLKKATD